MERSSFICKAGSSNLKCSADPAAWESTKEANSVLFPDSAARKVSTNKRIILISKAVFEYIKNKPGEEISTIRDRIFSLRNRLLVECVLIGLKDTVNDIS